MKIATKIVASLFVVIPSVALAQAKRDCSIPSILRITSQGGDVYFQMDREKAHRFYTLGEASKAVHDCPGDRMLFVVADPDVPIRDLMLPPKEQITKIRYFIQYRVGGTEEILFGSEYPKLPLTTDVKANPPDGDSVHPPTKIPTMKGPQ